jgi:hypothetical protein
MPVTIKHPRRPGRRRPYRFLRRAYPNGVQRQVWADQDGRVVIVGWVGLRRHQHI